LNLALGERPLEGGRRILRHIKHVGALGVLVELLMAEVDGVGVDRHLDRAGALVLVQDDVAGALGELAAPDRQASHVVGLKRRIGVCRVDLVGDRGGQRGGGNTEQGCHGGCGWQGNLHGETLLAKALLEQKSAFI
jgi:hypothetical protein